MQEIAEKMTQDQEDNVCNNWGCTKNDVQKYQDVYEYFEEIENIRKIVMRW